jgi:hypothetical protein
MMKRTVMFGVLVGALLGAASSSWAVDLKWGGDYRLRGFYIDNLTDTDKDTQDSAAYYSSRFLLTLAATEDNVSGVVTLAAGTNGTNGNRLLGRTSFGPDGSAIGLVEAYLKADFKTWGLKGGRAIYKLGNGIILDDAVDGLWANFGLGGMGLTVATLKLREVTDATVVPIGTGAAGTGTGDDADLYVINAGFGQMAMGPAHNLNLFAAYLIDRSAFLVVPAGSATQDVTLLILGASADADLGGLRLKGEFDFMNGTRKIPAGTDMDITGMNLVLGAKLDAGVIPLGVDLIYTTGLDPAKAGTEHNINGLSGNYPVGIILANTGAVSDTYKDGTCLSVGGARAYAGGALNCVDGNGLTAVKVSTGLVHGPHTIDVAAIYARSTEEPVVGGDTDLGIELDATLTWALTKRLSAMGGIGYLISGDYWKFGVAAAPTDNMTVLVTQLAYTF